MINWTENSSENLEIKAFLRAVWKNPAEDIGLYVEQLQEQKPTEETKSAFEFLKKEISKLRDIKDFTIVLPQIDSIIGDTGAFYDKYPDQKELAEKIKVFIEDYKKMQKSIKN